MVPIGELRVFLTFQHQQASDSINSTDGKCNFFEIQRLHAYELKHSYRINESHIDSMEQKFQSVKD